jgi:hypothetical protein
VVPVAEMGLSAPNSQVQFLRLLNPPRLSSMADDYSALDLEVVVVLSIHLVYIETDIRSSSLGRI